MKSIYSTILSSNGAGATKLMRDWVNNYCKAYKDKVKLVNNKVNIYGDYKSININISNIPTIGIGEIYDVDWVHFINIKETDINKLPSLYKRCTEVDFSYCTIPAEYKRLHPKIKFIHCTFI